LSSELALQYLLAGITSGSVYAIVAIGFNIVYNATGIINFAQGEFVMLGAMIAISLQPHMPLPFAILVAVLATGLIGALLELLFMRWLRQPSVLRMIIVTIGLSILLREAALHVWDEKVRALPYFTGSGVSSIRVFGAFISPQVLWLLGLAAAIVVLLTLFFRFTLTGRSMRACSANREAAALMGIDTRRMVTLSFAIAAAIGALAGCVVSPIAQTHYDCGAPLAIKGFTAAVLGGLGKSGGAVAAGLLLGVLEALSVSLMPAAYKDAIAVLALLLILSFRPSGLFGARDEARLKEY
jgi:branched-chain amino acid transport system permease protein